MYIYIYIERERGILHICIYIYIYIYIYITCIHIRGGRRLAPAGRRLAAGARLALPRLRGHCYYDDYYV